MEWPMDQLAIRFVRYNRSAPPLNQRVNPYEEFSVRLLVADDSGVMRKMIVRSLNAVAMTDCLKAVDGVDALSHYQST